MIYPGALVATPSTTDRPPQLQAVYSLLADLKERTEGPWNLGAVDGYHDWPERGIYFFFTPDSDLDTPSPTQWKLSRIGTVGVSTGSANTLWNRLRQHRGNTRGAYAGGGNHRGSIFRKHVGRAIIEAEGRHDQYPHWGIEHRAGIPIGTEELRAQEHPLEERVSEYIRDLPFLVLPVPGEPRPGCDRDRIETNLIGLVSHYRRSTPGLLMDDWLGVESPKPEVYKSGLWNIEHVNALYTPTILDDAAAYLPGE